MEEYKKELESIGFTGNKASVYLYIVKHPGVTAGVLIKQLKLQRSVVYANLEILENEGLITLQKVKGKVTEFFPTAAHNLVARQEEKLLIAEKLSRDFSRMNLSHNSEEVFMYHGPDAISFVCDQHFLNDDDSEVLFMGSSKYGDQAKLGGYWTTYHKKRISKKIPCRILYDCDTDSNLLIKRNELQLCEARYMPYGTNLPSWQCVWGEYTALFIPTAHVAYIIKNKEAAKGLRQLFEYLWKQSSKYRKY